MSKQGTIGDVSTETYWRPSDLRIGRNTFYDEDLWEFEVTTLGQALKAYRIEWGALGAPESLIASAWRPLLEELKCLIWTLRYDRRGRAPIDGGSIARITAAFRDLVPWMMESGYSSLSQVTSRASWDYVQWFRDNHERPRKGSKKARIMSFATAWQGLHILWHAYDQADPMRERGFEPMGQAPYGGRNAFDITVNDLKLHQSDKLDPFPDKLAIPLLTTAARWVALYAEDILRLHTLWLSDVLPQPNTFLIQKIGARIRGDFQFSNDPETGLPWMTFDGSWTRLDENDDERTITLGDAPRRLVSDLVSACLIVLMGTTGMRSSDVASIHVDEKRDGLYPSCIERRLSMDGLTEMFLLKGVEQKRSHAEHSWVLGGRLVGTDEQPLPLQAVLVLERLFAPYRKVSGERALVITFPRSRSLAVTKDNVNTIKATWVSNIQRNFANNYVKLGLTKHTRRKKSKERAFRTQQWRGTFAMFVIRTNKRALGPLATHFNHVDTLMTEHGYIGNDPELLQLVDDARVNLATNTLMSLVTESEPFAGGLEFHLRPATQALKAELRDLEEEDRLARIRGVVVDHNLRLHFTDYGICGIAVTPVIARCHQLSGTDAVGNERPNFATRRPSICAGCQNFLVSRDNLPFWKERAMLLRSTAPQLQADHAWRHGRELALAEQFVRILEGGPSDE
ncbi:hypothetical protein KK141_17270 [Dyella sp. LX-66]|uniref:hypothetical protein n=1 Tax=unclassified Dyella TaxID=2634549 RepID=UPI001BE03359|nr:MULTISPECIES: hypothetical protein [unclassified Dyella]MBT2117785.1 hypothetical protein [Dyella sp. LX-1]MBT2141300.1 hypothetical protein [Dyella sp. LX-66]